MPDCPWYLQALPQLSCCHHLYARYPAALRLSTLLPVQRVPPCNFKEEPPSYRRAIISST